MAFDPRFDHDLPPLDPTEDTHPSLVMPVVARDARPGLGRRALGAVMLVGAAALTVGTAWLLLAPPAPAPPPPADVRAATEALPTDVPLPTLLPVEQDAPAPSVSAVALLPTLAPEQAAALLAAPLAAAPADARVVARNVYAPFTVIPDRPRNEVIQVEIVRGDTIYTLAQRYGITPESVVWANDRNIVNVLVPGNSINIPPVDGVYHRAVGGATVREIVRGYGISDPYTILDSEFNREVLAGLGPDDRPPSGTRIMIPGGQAEQINWNPTVVREGGTSGGGQASGANYITFAPGDPGSCGRVVNPGGGAAWINPLRGYTWVRGFTSWHTGVDLSAAVGTPVYAANGGRVIFAGWNNWGYGYTVVLAHGPYTTLYGHLSAVYVSCGQDVGPGQSIAAVGNTGQSSGPHLHFEIRYNDQPQDPTYTIPF